MKVKCPKCKHEFEGVENPAPILDIPPKQKEIGAVSAHFVSTQSVAPGMKKGYEDIIQIIKENRGATWSELERKLCQKGPKLSTATISNRLKEGKQIGLFDEAIRKKSGRKIYKLRGHENEI